MKTLVIIPTYKEADNIRTVLSKLFESDDSQEVEALVVDDSSPDGTATIVEQIAKANNRVHLLSRPHRAGLGTAYVEGFGWALERDFEAVVEMDADLSHDPSQVGRLLEALEHADLVVGSRYVPGGHIENWGRLRRALSSYGNHYARAMLRFDVQDSTSGFRAYRAERLREIDLARVRAEGYVFQIEMVRRIVSAGGVTAEVPIEFSERTSGHSKMHRRIIVEALWWVTVWGLADRLRGLRGRPGSGPENRP